MSEAAFAAAEEEARAFEAEDEGDEHEDAELEAAETEEGEEEEPSEETEKPKRDWEKVAHDKEGALAKERSRRRALEREVREIRAALESKPKAADDDDALVKLIETLRDDDDDPISDLAGVKAALKTFIAQQKAEREQEGQVTQQQRAIQTLVSTVEEYEADFTADHPDYPKAAAHYKQARREELEEMGYAGEALQRELATDLLGLARRAIDGGRDPAEVVYGLAKKRGFAAGKEQADAKLRTIAEAAKGGRTPSGAKPGAGRVTYEMVAKAKGADRDAMWAKLREQERKAG